MDPFNFLFGGYASDEDKKKKEKEHAAAEEAAAVAAAEEAAAREAEERRIEEKKRRKKASLLGNGLVLRPYKNALLATGAKRILMPYTELFAEMDGNWNASLKGWVFPKNKEKKLRVAFPLLDVQTKKRARFSKARKRAVNRRNRKKIASVSDSVSDTSMEYSADEDESGSGESGGELSGERSYTDGTSVNSDVTEISFMVDDDLRPIGFRVPKHKIVAFIYDQIRLGDLREVTLREIYGKIQMEFKEDRLSRADKKYIREILEKCLEVAY
jgi:hypothetical protein